MQLQSLFGKLNWLDALKGLIVAIVGFILTGIYQAIDAETIMWTWAFFKPILLGGLGSGLAYLIKNVLTNSLGQPLKAEPKI